MEQYELLGLLVRCFESLGVRYFITGSVASMAYGEPRLTNDIDVVADLREEHTPALLERFPHPEFCLSAEAVGRAIRRRGQFNIIHPVSGLKADVIIPERSSFDDSRFARARKVRPVEDLEAIFSSPEDMIVKKLDFYREGGSDKHLRDIAGMIKISGASLDLDYISGWVGKMGLAETWSQVLDRVKADPHDSEDKRP
ncbi:MAG TPA: hypothetical protein PK280_02815 [Planctomycetota bacterium]|nr:hypothetical protein [Planctomycetota bacterium]